MIESVGPEVERYVFQFSQTRRKYDIVRQRLHEFDAIERETVVMLLADELEKLSSQNILFGSRVEGRLERCARKGQDRIELARELNMPSAAAEFAHWLKVVTRAEVPPEMRGWR